MIGMLLSLILPVLAGFSIMPNSGPEDDVIKSGITRSSPGFGLVKLTPGVVDILGEYGAGALAGFFRGRLTAARTRFGSVVHTKGSG